MKLRNLFTLALMLLAAPAFADTAPEYVMNKEKSQLKFIAIQNGAPVTSQFKDFSAKIFFDPAKLSQSSITVEVNTANVAGGSDEMLSSLKLPEWLWVEKFPKATYTTTKIMSMPNTQDYYADGQLELRGVKKPLTINFTLEQFDQQHVLATGYATLQRNDFGVGQGEWAKDDTIRNDVRVEFRIVADKK